MAAQLKMIADDPWLEQAAGELEYRYRLYREAKEACVRQSGSLKAYADGYRYFGFQRDDRSQGWWFREWLPEADEVYLFGDFNGWQRRTLPLVKDSRGVWSIFLYDGDWGQGLRHGSLYKMLVHGANGWHERIPAYARRVVQDDRTKDFTAQFWHPADAFDWGADRFDIASLRTLYIYESHIGMALEAERVGTYAEFAEQVLPRIRAAGYNAVQLMALAEHPYYGSFGYHVSSFFAPSSRFGTPEELKALVRRAHAMGLAVIMDLVHAHYVKNLNEGLNQLDGSDHLYSPAGEAGRHPYWDSMLFDYAKPEVRRFLLSNIRYWLEEFHFDGFRFDGVTSMIYTHHGYTESEGADLFFGGEVNRAGLTYLTLANELVKEVKPSSVTIAEEVSGMPGICTPVVDGGVGFDYRLGMAVPDFWIRMLKDTPDEAWNIWEIWHVLTDRLPTVRTVAYAESHDQALVGDQTIAFRLMGSAMYTAMERGRDDLTVERGMALHKMIRLVTLALGGEAYLNFMGNEFGHPEWIDFPREGNGWSYRYARRQWSLADNDRLRYGQLGLFDRAMLAMAETYGVMRCGYAYNQLMDEANKTMAFSHGDLLFVFNWHPTASVADYRVPVPRAGRYRTLLATDDPLYGGQGRDDASVIHFSEPESDDPLRHFIRIYNICRTATVYRRLPEASEASEASEA